ncbi:arsenate reductase/protein-tyrosine-phosphatase family protein [Corynebacterium gallinarum]|uniref:Low molecular weight phosphatase family protein n=1 Tax=Corynebacterium gallinarum TaxID=2762214 RepID=A0A8I0HQ61_9CORY|nr:low molecular weight phosphatase family protein [Corynebacterium gallinarum]MBD8031014.1 low molecular weight phosphatase family protein [Corynebacterium gallinarum]
MSDSFRILTVCTGNICRSPLAEQLLKSALRGVEHIEFDSAGTQAMVDNPMPEHSLEIAKNNEISDAELHRGKQLLEAHLDSADLILAMDRGHRRKIVELSSRATRKVFTVREFKRLIDVTTDEYLRAEILASDGTPVGKLRAAVDAARLGRSDLIPLDNPDDDDVVDPYGQDKAVYDASAQQLVPVVADVASYLRRAMEME